MTLSFLQLYRETVQDLLAPVAESAAHPSDSNAHEKDKDNLVIREDPHRGFYVEGLSEFIVREYSEAEALLNLGLENRAIAPTLMNSTSSRSHTVLTINIEQKGLVLTSPGLFSEEDGEGDEDNATYATGRQSSVGSSSYARTIRSKLLMVDLAGSERVRRT